MSDYKIYHNPRCGKSRNTLQLLRDKGIEPEIIEYLKEIPSKTELKEVLAKLNLKADEILRKGEAIYKENYKGKSFTEDEWIDILIKNPILIERPIVITGNKAVLGRPPENIEQLF